MILFVGLFDITKYNALFDLMKFEF